jgi:hypothetical protein
MTKFYTVLVTFTLLIAMGSCAAPAAKELAEQDSAQPTLSPIALPEPTMLPDLSIARHPAAADFSAYFPQITSIPKYDPASMDPFQVDLRSQDLTGIDMTASLADLQYATFDSKTQWPLSNQMPAEFDWQNMMEIGKDPGLGVRSLHDQGITGKGVGIAIIDQPLLVDHVEYKDRLQLYEEINVSPDSEAAMHGAAVTSIAVGKTVGVAPEADLYYIATGFCGAEKFEELDFACWAKAVRRIVEFNENLPADRKIRVLSLSWGWSTKSTGYKQISAAVNEAKDAGIFVISSSLGHTDELYFQGLGRQPLDESNRLESYTPGLWWEKGYFADPLNYYFGNPPEPLLLVPMDSRTTASPTGTEDYAFYRVGGWSWSIPYLAGMYALAVQVDSDITPKEFWETALETGRTIPIQHDGKEYELGAILNPQALISSLK